MRYLGTYIIKGRQFRCSVTNAKRSFNWSVNAIFGKVGRIASEEATLQLVKSKSTAYFTTIVSHVLQILQETKKTV